MYINIKITYNVIGHSSIVQLILQPFCRAFVTQQFNIEFSIHIVRGLFFGNYYFFLLFYSNIVCSIYRSRMLFPFLMRIFFHQCIAMKGKKTCDDYYKEFEDCIVKLISIGVKEYISLIVSIFNVNLCLAYKIRSLLNPRSYNRFT